MIKLVELFKTIQKRHRYFYVALFSLSISNIIWSSALLLIVNGAVQGKIYKILTVPPSLVYITLVIISFIVTLYLQRYFIRISTEFAYDLGMSIYEKLRFSSYEDFTNLGKEKIYSLNGDINTMSNFPGNIVGLINSSIFFVMGVGYLFYISPVGGGMITIVLSMIGYLFYLKNRKANTLLWNARKLSDIFFRNVNDLLLGFREIKMSVKQNDGLYNHLNKNRLATKDLEIKTSYQFFDSELMGRYTWYCIMGVIIFILPGALDISTGDVSLFLVVLLFLIGPVAGIISAAPFINRTNVSFANLIAYDTKISSFNATAIQHGVKPVGYGKLQEIKLEGVQYFYQRQGEFFLHVESLSIKKGELIFIVGGNGSGKSTAINILTGLVKPTKGNVFLNDELITDETYPYYRDQFSTIFADNYTFSENYDRQLTENEKQEFADYITLFRLGHVLSPDLPVFNPRLSKGQQKRLAMIYALLDRKEVLVLDEWAADQDPEFRKYFYTTLLAKLKNEGKTIILVSHDDLYYEHADRVIKMNFGRIISDLKRVASVEIIS